MMTAGLREDATPSAAPEPTPEASSSIDSAPVADPSPEPKPDPTLRMITISGWAKFGGGSPDEAIAECVATLGPAHQPDIANHRITRGLLACMRAKNWLAL